MFRRIFGVLWWSSFVSLTTVHSVEFCLASTSCVKQKLPALLQEAKRQMPTQQPRFLIHSLLQQCRELPPWFRSVLSWHESVASLYPSMSMTTKQQMTRMIMQTYLPKACPVLNWHQPQKVWDAMARMTENQRKYHLADACGLLTKQVLSADILSRDDVYPEVLAVLFWQLVQLGTSDTLARDFLHAAWLAQSSFHDILLLPSKAQTALFHASTLAIQGRDLLVNRKLVWQFPSETSTGGTTTPVRPSKKPIPSVLPALTEILQQEAKKRHRISRFDPALPFQGRLLFVIDKNTTVRLLFPILRTVRSSTSFLRYYWVVGGPTIPFIGPSKVIPFAVAHPDQAWSPSFSSSGQHRVRLSISPQELELTLVNIKQRTSRRLGEFRYHPARGLHGNDRHVLLQLLWHHVRLHGQQLALSIDPNITFQHLIAALETVRWPSGSLPVLVVLLPIP